MVVEKCNVYNFVVVALKILKEILDFIIIIFSNFDFKGNSRSTLANSISYGRTGYFLFCNYSICMLTHQTKVSVYIEMGVPIEFLSRIRNQLLTPYMQFYYGSWIIKNLIWLKKVKLNYKVLMFWLSVISFDELIWNENAVYTITML